MGAGTGICDTLFRDTGQLRRVWPDCRYILFALQSAIPGFVVNRLPFYLILLLTIGIMLAAFSQLEIISIAFQKLGLSPRGHCF